MLCNDCTRTQMLWAIGGVYHSVSSKHLQACLDEYSFRYNHREDPGGMFSAFLNRIEKDAAAS